MIEQNEKATESKTCLLFSIKNVAYAIEVTTILEILELPAWKHVPGVPSYIAGFINVRGEIMVALNLKACFGEISHKLSLKDHLIVIEGQNYSFCLISPEITDLVLVEQSEAISETMLSDIAPLFPFISNIAKYEEKIVFLIDPIKLETHLLKTVPEIFNQPQEVENNFELSVGDEEEKKIFEERALRLNERIAPTFVADQINLMIILLEQEHYAVETMREFCPITEVSIVPCAPDYIFGLFNLRGRVLPLIDILEILQGKKNELKKTSKALIVDFEGHSLGILVDDMVNLISTEESEFRSVPITVKAISQTFIKNTVKYEKEVIPLLDITKMLKSIVINT